MKHLPIDLSYSVGPENKKSISSSIKETKLVRQDASVTLTQSLFSCLFTLKGLNEQKELILSA